MNVLVASPMLIYDSWRYHHSPRILSTLWSTIIGVCSLFSWSMIIAKTLTITFLFQTTSSRRLLCPFKEISWKYLCILPEPKYLTVPS